MTTFRAEVGNEELSGKVQLQDQANDLDFEANDERNMKPTYYAAAIAVEL